MSYLDARDYILGFANFEIASAERLRYREFNLARVRAALTLLDDPHLSYPTVHIAGTKGKGSTAAMVASVVRAAGHRVGLYTSPHLHTVRERIAVDGAAITEKDFAAGVDEIKSAIAQVNADGRYGRISTFEALTLLAFHHFRQAKVGYAVIEVGLGGRLDATSVVAPEVCAITNISLDHTDVLGESLAEIAAEKSAIIKPGIRVVSAPQAEEVRDVIRAQAARSGAPLIDVGREVRWRRLEQDLGGQLLELKTSAATYRTRLPLLGAHQMENAATAVAIAEALETRGVEIGALAVQRGLEGVQWPARMEVLGRNPLVMVDGAHNLESMRALCGSLREEVPFGRLTVIFGANRSKNIMGMLTELARLPVSILVTRSRHPKAASVEEVTSVSRDLGIPVGTARNAASALDLAMRVTGINDVILATGSLFIAAEVRESVMGIEPEPASPAAIVTV